MDFRLENLQSWPIVAVPMLVLILRKAAHVRKRESLISRLQPSQTSIGRVIFFLSAKPAIRFRMKPTAVFAFEPALTPAKDGLAVLDQMFPV